MQKYDHNIGFREKRQFFAENCRKSQKIVIITSVVRMGQLWLQRVLQAQRNSLPQFGDIIDSEELRLKVQKSALRMKIYPKSFRPK
jgi:hypothetical protein